MEYTIAAYTDVGTQKQVNQDSLCIRRASIPNTGEMLMAVVCDGMGGLQKGELASAICIQEFGIWFDQNLEHFPALCGNGFTEVKRHWEELLQRLHQKLSDYSASRGIRLGSTLTAILTYGSRYLTVNIGDSRIYIRGQRLEQITQDQSLVAKEVALGRITEVEARHHPQRNVLLQCLGVGGSIHPVFTEGILPGGVLILLCTDGLVHEIPPEELTEQLSLFRMQTREAMTDVLRALTELCRRRGESDNMTAVLVKTVESSVNRPSSGIRRFLNRFFEKKQADGPQASALLETAQITHVQERVRLE